MSGITGEDVETFPSVVFQSPETNGQRECVRAKNLRALRERQ